VRVARKLLGQLITACGGDVSKVNPQVHVENVSRMMTARDPWVNILRNTLSTFGAALGGADSISALPFTHALGQPTSLARRIARNSQVILAEEANIGKVIDPAGGSWALEKMTQDYARIGWNYFQDIQRQGGILDAITSGWLQDWIGKAKEDRANAIATRKAPMTGTSEFPDLFEEPITAEPVDRDAIRNARPAASGASPVSSKFDDLIAAALDGADMAALMAPFTTTPAKAKPLLPYRLTEGFEALRDASDAELQETGARPKIFLCNIGTIPEFNARAAFAKNAFEAGGIETLSSDGFDNAKAAAKAFKASGAKLAVLCSSDKRYAVETKAFADALKKAGVAHLYLAGHPSTHREVYDAAGIDDFIYSGCDLLATLEQAHEILRSAS
jgi:methylmalonyl-CoA mutase